MPHCVEVVWIICKATRGLRNKSIDMKVQNCYFPIPDQPAHPAISSRVSIKAIFVSVSVSLSMSICIIKHTVAGGKVTKLRLLWWSLCCLPRKCLNDWNSSTAEEDWSNNAKKKKRGAFLIKYTGHLGGECLNCPGPVNQRRKANEKYDQAIRTACYSETLAFK